MENVFLSIRTLYPQQNKCVNPFETVGSKNLLSSRSSSFSDPRFTECGWRIAAELRCFQSLQAVAVRCYRKAKEGKKKEEPGTIREER